MSSLDGTYEHMVNFRRALEQFGESLSASATDMARHHEDVAPVWNDRNRMNYDAQWEPLREEMDIFMKDTYPRLTEFLDEKIRALTQYLDRY